MNVLTFVLGLISLGLVRSDVSHLRQNQHYRGQQRFVPGNGEVVRQSFNQNSAATFSNRAYESAGKDARYKPIYTRPPAHNRVQRGCNGCASRSQNTRQITQQNTYNQIQNPFLNAKTHPSFNSFQSPIVTGSPSEVNNFLHQMIESGRQQQSSSCADSTSACVAPKFCFNGYIDQSVEHKAVRSSVSYFGNVFYATRIIRTFEWLRTPAHLNKRLRILRPAWKQKIISFSLTLRLSKAVEKVKWLCKAPFNYPISKEEQCS